MDMYKKAKVKLDHKALNIDIFKLGDCLAF